MTFEEELRFAKTWHQGKDSTPNLNVIQYLTKAMETLTCVVEELENKIHELESRIKRIEPVTIKEPSYRG